MSKFRKEIRSDFTTVHNAFIVDSRLYNDSAGLLLRMLKLPDDWNFSIKGLSAILRDGERKIARQLDELSHAGYVVRNRIHSKDGKFFEWEYIISDEPLPDEIRKLDYKYGKEFKSEEETDINRKNDVNTSFSPHRRFADVDIADVHTVDDNKIKKNKIKNNKFSQSISQSKSNCKLTQENENNSQNDLTDLTDKAGSLDKSVRKGFEEQISFNKLIRDKPEYKDQLCALTGIASELLAQKHQGSVRIMGQEKSLSEVKEKYSRLRYEHILRLLDVLNARLRDGKVPENPVPYIISMLFTVVDEHDVTAFIRAAPKQDSMDHSFDLNEYKALVNQFD